MLPTKYMRNDLTMPIIHLHFLSFVFLYFFNLFYNFFIFFFVFVILFCELNKVMKSKGTVYTTKTIGEQTQFYNANSPLRSQSYQNHCTDPQILPHDTDEVMLHGIG